MAATGATPISLYYSTTASTAPTAGNLVNGELAINITDGILYYKDNAGAVQKIGTKGGVGSSTTTQVLYNSSGAVVGSANFTFNGTTVTIANDASISGLTVGKGGGAVALNTAVGNGALALNTTADRGTAVGYQALYSNTTQNANTAVGYQSLYSNTTGGINTAVGYQSMYLNSTGTNNIGFGYSALYANTTGGSNSALGYQALASNTTASNNTAVGYQAAYSNTTGTTIDAFGKWALYSNTTGNENSAFGYAALYKNTTGNYNAAFARSALEQNTTGSNNIAFGEQALANNTTASGNTAVGYQAGYSGTTAQYNTFVGGQSGYTITTGAGNTILGFQAGNKLTTGSRNTFIGGSDNSTNYGAGYYITTGNSNTVLGSYNGNQGGLDIRTASNYIVLSDGDGNPRQIIDSSGNVAFGANTNVRNSRERIISYSTTGEGFLSQVNDLSYAGWIHKSIQSSAGTHFCAYFENSSGTYMGQITHNNTTVSYTSASDYRLKENVQPMTGALAKVQALKPVTYSWKSNGSNGQGFIAHELAEVCPDAVTGEKDAVDAEGNPIYQGIDTSFLVATLTAAIQELKAEVDSLKQQLGK